MGETAATGPDRTISAPRAFGVLVASGLAAVSALVITMVAARYLTVGGDAHDYREFMVFWSLLFGVYGIVVGVQNESTRAMGSVRIDPGQATGARLMTMPLLLGGAVAVAVALSSALWAERLVPSTSPAIIALIAAGIVAYACYQTLLGAQGGGRHWGQFALTMSGDAVGRLALVVVAAIAGAGLWGVEVATIAAALVWLVIPICFRQSRRAITARVDVPLGQLLRNGGLAMVSSTSTAILVTAYPVLMQLVDPHEDAVVMAATVTALSLSRTPILLPLQAFQGVAISSFVGRGNGAAGALVRPLLMLCGVGLAATALMALVGPWFLPTFYGSTYQLGAGPFAALTMAGLGMAVITLTGAATIAVNRHSWFSFGWVSAAIIAVLLLFVPLELPYRAALSLLAGSISGAAIHLAAIRRPAAPAGQAPTPGNDSAHHNDDAGQEG